MARGQAMSHDLYRLYDKYGELLYVGESYNAKERLKAHRKRAWGHLIERVEVEQFRDTKYAKEAEIEAIKNEYPKYNLTHSVDEIAARKALAEIGEFKKLKKPLAIVEPNCDDIREAKRKLADKPWDEYVDYRALKKSTLNPMGDFDKRVREYWHDYSATTVIGVNSDITKMPFIYANETCYQCAKPATWSFRSTRVTDNSKKLFGCHKHTYGFETFAEPTDMQLPPSIREDWRNIVTAGPMRGKLLFMKALGIVGQPIERVIAA